jgi:hypothetical protein
LSNRPHPRRGVWRIAHYECAKGLFSSEIPRCYTFSNKEESGGWEKRTTSGKSIPASLYFLSVELLINTQQ